MQNLLHIRTESDKVRLEQAMAPFLETTRLSNRIDEEAQPATESMTLVNGAMEGTSMNLSQTIRNTVSFIG